MRLPKKIDHRLVDTIIRVQFLASVPPESVIGYVHSCWREQSVGLVTERIPKLRFGPTDLTLEPSPSFFFLTADNRFRVDVDNISITFNSVGDYTGWSDFETVFQRCIQPLFDQSIIGQVQRLGVRYINRFDQIRIFDHIDMSVRVGRVVPANSRQQVRAEFDRNGFLSVLTLVNDYPSEPVQIGHLGEHFFSLIDVDVIKLFNQTNPPGYIELISALEAAHTEEKTIFFGLLTESFLKTLNPVY